VLAYMMLNVVTYECVQSVCKSKHSKAGTSLRTYDADNNDDDDDNDFL